MSDSPTSSAPIAWYASATMQTRDAGTRPSNGHQKAVEIAPRMRKPSAFARCATSRNCSSDSSVERFRLARLWLSLAEQKRTISSGLATMARS